MALAFKLYGDFHWPPTSGPAPAEPPVPPAPPPTEQGVIEIHFVAQPGVPEHRPLLRWIPRARIDNKPLPEPPPTCQRCSVSFPTILVPTGSRSGSTTTGIPGGCCGSARARRDRSPTAVSPSSAAASCSSSTSPTATARMTCSGRSSRKPLYRASPPVYSVLGLCHKAKPLLYFNFHLPLPVRRSSLAGSTPDNAAFFPFSAVYDLTPATTEKLITIDKLFGGWQKDDLLPAPDADQDPCFAFGAANYPKTPRLGHFGFAEFENSAGTDFARFNLPEPINQRYWPSTKRRCCRTSCGATDSS